MIKSILIVIVSIFSTATYCQVSDSLINRYYEVAKIMLVDKDYDKAHIGFIDLYREFIDEDNYVYAVFCLDFGINCLYSQQKHAEMIPFLDLAFEHLNTMENIRCNQQLQTDINYLAACAHHKVGNPSLSLFYANEAASYYEYGKSFSYQPELIYIHSALSSMILGDYKTAVKSYQKVVNTKNTDALDLLFNTFGQLGGLHTLLGDEAKSRSYFDICRSYLDSLTIHDQNKLIYYRHVTKYHLKRNNLDSARHILNETKKLNLGLNSLLNFYQSSGHYELKKDNFENAESYFLKGINLCLDTFSYNKYKLAETYLQTSLAYSSVDRIEEALGYTDDCLDVLVPDLIETNDVDPSVSLNHRLTVNVLLLKAELLSKNKEYSRAKIAINQSQLFLDHMFHKTLLSQESRLFFVSKMKKEYESIIKIALDNHDPEFAFQVSQKIHGNLLSLELFKNEVAETFNVPTEYTNYVQSLKVRISSKESDLSRLDKIENTVKYDSLENNINYLKGEFDNVLASIEKAYPEYYKLKYTSPPINSVQNIQHNHLTNSSALIEYFMGESKLYTFVISKNDLKVFTSEIDSSFTQNILTLNNSIRSIDSDFNSFTSSSIYFYNFLLKDVIQHLGPGISKFYIIPDNEINYVPFEALIKDIPNSAKNSRYDLLHYAVQDYSMSYHYSSALLNNRKTSLSNNITGFAPSFTSNFSAAEDLESLLYNKQEVLIIKDITDGQINVDTAATLKKLKESVKEFRIAHLATHAKCNDTLPFESKIYLEDGPLHAYEIYNMPSELDLAVLSACETGTGVLKNGEGLLSLARAFISNGCQSVITSLWTVNDQKSVDLMTYFYSNLYNGETIGESLTTAKRDYLTNVNSSLEAHPHHWATFIMVGNAEMAIHGFPWFILFILGMAVFLLVLLYLKPQRQ